MEAIAAPLSEPLVVYCSPDRSGTTYALELSAREQLKARFGSALSVAPRLFIARDGATGAEPARGILSRHVISLLTGLSEDQLRELGPVEFREPVTERTLGTWAP